MPSLFKGSMIVLCRPTWPQNVLAGPLLQPPIWSLCSSLTIWLPMMIFPKLKSYWSLSCSTVFNGFLLSPISRVRVAKSDSSLHTHSTKTPASWSAFQWDPNLVSHDYTWVFLYYISLLSLSFSEQGLFPIHLKHLPQWSAHAWANTLGHTLCHSLKSTYFSLMRSLCSEEGSRLSPISTMGKHPPSSKQRSPLQLIWVTKAAVSTG